MQILGPENPCIGMFSVTYLLNVTSFFFMPQKHIKVGPSVYYMMMRLLFLWYQTANLWLYSILKVMILLHNNTIGQVYCKKNLFNSTIKCGLLCCEYLNNLASDIYDTFQKCFHWPS